MLDILDTPSQTKSTAGSHSISIRTIQPLVQLIRKTITVIFCTMSQIEPVKGPVYEIERHLGVRYRIPTNGSLPPPSLTKHYSTLADTEQRCRQVLKYVFMKHNL